jgi:GNAT superfamily N-acetyltransferase
MISPRIAAPVEIETVVDILVSAFRDDPTWCWALPDPVLRVEQLRALWTEFATGAMRYPWTWLVADASVAVWIPPGGTELSADQEVGLEPLIEDLVGSEAWRVFSAFELFEQAHPHDEPHYFLSLLGTRSENRGHGIGLGLLAANLRTIDETGLPAYLEASNPGNVALYRRYGFEVLGSFVLPDGGPEVFTMWRAGGGHVP